MDVAESTLTKEDINKLPLQKYEGPVDLVADGPALRQAVTQLESERVLGFDIEVRPAFRRGENHPPALLQLAASERVFIFQLLRLSDRGEIGRLLGDPGILKVGIGIGEDIKKLQEALIFRPAGFIDLSTLAAQRGVPASGVRTLAASLLGFRVSKGARCSNWERQELTRQQIDYAATDAWVCREIYFRLQRLRK